MIKIPFTFYLDNVKEEPDWESMGIEKPSSCDADSPRHVANVLVNPMVINYIEPYIDGEGCYVNLMDKDWHTPLSIEELEKLINES